MEALIIDIDDLDVLLRNELHIKLVGLNCSSYLVGTVTTTTNLS